MTRIKQTYKHILEDTSSLKINAAKDVLAEIAQVIQECAQFIVKYSETNSFCMSITSVLSYSHGSLIFFIGLRLGKNVLSETASKVINYNSKLDKLMQDL